MLSDLAQYVKFYYDERGLMWPNFEQAMAFAHTEIGEAYEVYLDQFDGWVRNNPDDKPEFDNDALLEELGDAIMMLVVAGLVIGGDPVEALSNKILRKLAANEA